MNKDEYKAKCQWLANLYREAAESGRAIQYAASERWVAADEGPSLNSRTEDYRLKPEPPKAWVVWYNGGGSIWITTDHEKAVSFANHNCSDATIQEITKPD